MNMRPTIKAELYSASLIPIGFLALLVSCGDSSFHGESPSTPETIVEATPEQISETEVHFGDGKVFHIGDGKYSESSCKQRIDAYALTGTRYFFEFEVTQPSTAVDVSINTICGVDYPQVNWSRLVNGATSRPLKVLPVSADRLTVDRLTLDPGRYALVVESGIGQENPAERDHDDFIVGKIAIKADKKINAGAVRTE
jgi:hypothetical protein